MASTTIKEKLKTYIRAGEFDKTVALYRRVSLKSLEDLLIEIGKPRFKIENTIAYSYVCFLISLHERKELHVLAARVLQKAFCEIYSLYKAARYHFQRALELDPEDVTLKEEVLQFYYDGRVDIAFEASTTDEDAIPREEACELAQAILKSKPWDRFAQTVLDMFTK